MRILRRKWTVLPLLAFALVVTGAHGDEGYVGDETCEMCHEDVVLQFARTPHAIASGWDPERGCESCHGPGEKHIEEADPELIRRPSPEQAREVNAMCMECHKRQESHFSYRQSIHALNDVACTSCHNPHVTNDQLLERSGRELCGDCHGAIAAQFDLARSHPIDDCSDCHEPHQARSLRTDGVTLRETCSDCHFDKAGPFLYDHDVTLVDGCASCHEVHGSPNRHLLQHEQQVNLCYQCHSAAVTPSWHSAPGFLTEKCTACHTAIHGSNTHQFFLEE